MLRSQADPDGLCFGVVLQRFFPQVQPEAGELVAPEGRRGIIEVVRVDPDRPGLDRARDVQKAHRVARAIKAGTVWVNTYNFYDPAARRGAPSGRRASRRPPRART